MNIKEKIDEGWLHCHIVLEVLGRPADYVNKTLHFIVDGLAKEKDVEIIDKNFFKPKKIKNLFSVFVEIEMLVKGIDKLIAIVFDFMPSSIEIVEPPQFKMKINDANNLINDLAAKLHKYDSTTKNLSLQNVILQKQIEELKKGKPIVDKEVKEKKTKKRKKK